MKILGLDLGINLGWCEMEDEKYIDSGVEVFNIGKFESPGMRWVRFERWLRERAGRVLYVRTIPEIQSHHLDFLAFETPPPTLKGDARIIFDGFLTIILKVCAELDIDHTSVAVPTLKKFATGKGNAGKKEMVHALVQWWIDTDVKFDPKGYVTDDQADACHVARWCHEKTKAIGGE